MMDLIARLYEAVTGTPYKTIRSSALEFGPSPAVKYPELLLLPDSVCLQHELPTLLAMARSQPRRFAQLSELEERIRRGDFWLAAVGKGARA